MIQSGLWWCFLVGGPVIYWLLPVLWRTPALALASLTLLAMFAGSDLAVMVALALAVFAVFRLPGGVRDSLPAPLDRKSVV